MIKHPNDRAERLALKKKDTLKRNSREAVEPKDIEDVRSQVSETEE